MHRLLVPALVLLTLACSPTGRGRDDDDTDPTPKPDAGSCDGTPCGGGCCGPGLACEDDRCVACTPQCTGLQCGDNGCGGSCGTCVKGFCNAGTCDESCTPSCSGRSCGDDGCGGTCGTCTSGTCNSSGQCVTSCTRQCSGRQCGDDGCGGSCGTCSSGTCNGSGQCVTSCTRQCSGRQCGDDGCGGSCGACTSGTCNASRQCVASCTPQCSGRQCGNDGCGGSCGNCTTGTCGTDGRCTNPMPTWSSVSITTPQVGFATAIYDPVGDRAIISGGETNTSTCRNGTGTIACSFSDQLLAFDGTRYTALTQSATRPVARIGAALVFDGTGALVLHGGLAANNTVRNDMWSWKNGTWTARSPAGAPFVATHALARIGTSFTTFGGLDSSLSASNTFGYFDLTFSSYLANPTSSGRPTGRSDFAWAVDEDRQALVVFGGSATNGSMFSDTWEFTAAAGWVQTTTFGPSGRLGARLAWDPNGHRLLLFGGCNETVTMNDLWEYRDGTWSALATSGPTPPVRCQHVFQRTSNGRFVVAGGLDFGTSLIELRDTWILNP